MKNIPIYTTMWALCDATNFSPGLFNSRANARKSLREEKRHAKLYDRKPLYTHVERVRLKTEGRA